jgi:hypothetical protein
MKVALIIICTVCLSCSVFKKSDQTDSSDFSKEVKETLKKQVITDATWAMQQEPVTVTANSSPRSAGSKHDFYSEGDYWWPDPKSIDSPYVQRDGLTNPDNFIAHRLAMIRFSRIIGASCFRLQNHR